MRFRRFVGGLVVLVVAIGLPLQAQPALAQVTPPTEVATLLNNIELALLVPPSIDPSGVTYLAHSDTLLVSDSEVDEERGVGNPPCDPPLPPVFDGANLFEITRSGSLMETGLSPESTFFKEPTGLGYNPANQHVFISNDDQDRIYEVDAGVDGIYGTPDDTVTSFPTSGFGATDPEDVAYDTLSGDLFIANGLNRSVYRVDPGANGSFDGVDDTVSSFDISDSGLIDLEGIEYRASSDTLLVVDSGPNESVNEFTKDGVLLRRIDIGVAQKIGVGFVPSDVALAPASDGSGATSMYIVDRGTDNGTGSDCVLPMDGRLYEMSAPFLAVTPGPGDPPPPPPPPPPTGLICGDDVFPGEIIILDLAGLSSDAVHAIQCLASYEITTGTGPGTFSPHDQVPRWQMAAFLIRQAAIHGVIVPVGSAQGFTDISGFDPSIQTAINQLAQLGITQGTSATTFSPNQMVPRWQMAIFLARLLTQVGVTLPAGTDQGFTDIGSLTAVAQTAINQLAQLGISTGTSPTTFDPLSPVARWQMALFLNRTLEVGGTP